MRIQHQRSTQNQKSDEEILTSLSKRLKRLAVDKEISQRDIEAATGVDQTTVSRAMNGRLKRVTENVKRIEHYASMRKTRTTLPGEVRDAANAFLRAGGQKKELLAFIRDATRLILRSVPDDM